MEVGPPAPPPAPRPPAVALRLVLLVELITLLVVVAVVAVLHSTLAIVLSSTALLVTLALDRGVQILTRWRLRRSLAIATVAIVSVGAVAGIGFAVIPPAISQGKALFKQIPGYVRQMQGSSLFRRLDEHLNLTERVHETTDKQATGDLLSGAAKPVWEALSGVVSVLGAMATVFFLALFMLIFGGRVVRAALREVPAEKRATYEALLDKVYRSVSGYISGLALICAINAAFSTTFLAINHVPFFLPLGLLSGLSSTIPYAGPFVSATFISALTLLTEGPWRCLASIVYFVVYGLIEGNILGPLIFRRTVEVNPLIVTLSILFFGEMFGIAGAVFAVPLVATLQIIVREILAARAQRVQRLV